MKKIIITTTFRSFEGNINDKMQILFLKSLREQTYQNFVLLVTIFNEKNVEKIVSDILGSKADFVYSEIPKQYRYSLSRVILNGIDYGIEKECDILLDCSGDIILEKNFLQTVNDFFSPMYAGVSHPNIFYDVDCDYRVVRKRVGNCAAGIDIRFFDIALLNCDFVKKRLEKYILYDWGGIELLLFALSLKYGSSLINVFEETKIIKTENDREALNENNEYLQKSAERNIAVLTELTKEIGENIDNVLDLFYVHKHYKLTKNQLGNFMYFFKERLKWRRNRIRGWRIRQSERMRKTLKKMCV